MVDEFFAALTEAEDDDDVKVVIFKGAGPSFSSGHDLTEVGYVYGYGDGKKGEKKRRPSQRIRLKLDRFGLNEPRRRIFLCPKITIAQVQGYCAGEGTMVMTECDLTIAAEDAQIGHPEQRLGFAGSSIPTIPHLIMSIGMKRALYMLLTGSSMSGKEAEEVGLVTMAVPAANLDEEVDKLANAVTLLPRDGIAIGKATRHLLYDQLGLTAGYAAGYYSQTLFSNIVWEPDEYSFFIEKRTKGAEAALREVNERYTGLVD